VVLNVYKIIGADGKEYGPITAEQLRRWIAEGRANAQSKVLAEGAMEWKPLAEVAEFVQDLATPASSPSPPMALSSPQAPRTNPLAVVGMVLGTLAVTFGLCCCYGLPFNVPGIICSTVALAQIKNDPQNQQGKGLAIAGLLLSILSIVLVVLFLVLGVALNSGDLWRKVQRL